MRHGQIPVTQLISDDVTVTIDCLPSHQRPESVGAYTSRGAIDCFLASNATSHSLQSNTVSLIQNFLGSVGSHFCLGLHRERDNHRDLEGKPHAAVGQCGGMAEMHSYSIVTIEEETDTTASSPGTICRPIVFVEP